jgi:hypothetical protein
MLASVLLASVLVAGLEASGATSAPASKTAARLDEPVSELPEEHATARAPADPKSTKIVIDRIVSLTVGRSLRMWG